MGGARGGDRAGRRPAVSRHARCWCRGRRRFEPGNGGDTQRRRNPRLPPGRRAPSRDAVAGVGILHLQRSGPRNREGEAGRAASALRRSRRPSRRRRPGDPLGRSRRHDGLVPRERPVSVSGQRVGGGGRRGPGRRLGCQRAARARYRRAGLADGGRNVAPRTRGGVRARHRREPARLRHARLGPARSPQRHDDGDGRGGPPRRRHRPSLDRWALAGDRWRWLWRIPSRAAGLGPCLARGRPPRGSGSAARGVAGSLGRGSRPIRRLVAAGDSG